VNEADPAICRAPRSVRRDGPRNNFSECGLSRKRSSVRFRVRRRKAGIRGPESWSFRWIEREARFAEADSENMVVFLDAIYLRQ